jgi:hypothetical protein
MEKFPEAPFFSTNESGVWGEARPPKLREKKLSKNTAFLLIHGKNVLSGFFGLGQMSYSRQKIPFSLAGALVYSVYLTTSHCPKIMV